jgi:hypothetical protein
MGQRKTIVKWRLMTGVRGRWILGIPGTGAREVPSTGPRIVVGTLVLLGATLIVGRGVLKR